MFGRVYLWSHLFLDFLIVGSFFWLLIKFHCWELASSYLLFLPDLFLRDDMYWSFFLFHYRFFNLGPSSPLFLMSLTKDLSILLFSKKQLPEFIIHWFFNFFYSLFGYFCSNFYYIFPSTTGLMACSFSNSFSCKVRLFEIFLLLEVDLCRYKLPS